MQVTIEVPVQKNLFCSLCGGWGTVIGKNPVGQTVVTTCPHGCKGPTEIGIPDSDACVVRESPR